MTVQVNGRYLVQRITGVQRYAREIVARLGEKVEVIAPRGTAKGVRGHLWEQTVLPIRLRRGVLWSPCATGPLTIASQVVTIHDCAFYDSPGGFSRAFAWWYQHLVPRLARRARRILTVSAFSRDRICELFGIPEEKVVVTYNGVAADWKPAPREAIEATLRKLELTAPYVVCVGSLEPRKNLRRLLTAWERLGAVKNGVQLVLVGASSHVFQNAGLHDLPADVRLAGHVGDDDLRGLMTGAEAFIMPSLYEGFGLPIVEAMACGTPVVCSSASALPEVAGNAAVLVDPLDPESIAAGLTQILEDRSLRERLRAAGVIRARQFSWDETASRTWDVLQQAL